jgi:hypothetical protein
MKRTFVISTLVAVVLVAVALALASVASAGQKKPASSSGQTKAEQCANLKLMSDLAYESAREALLAGDMEHYWLMKDASRAYENNARNLGCSWAKQAQTVSQTTSGPVIDSPSVTIR